VSSGRLAVTLDLLVEKHNGFCHFSNCSFKCILVEFQHTELQASSGCTIELSTVVGSGSFSVDDWLLMEC